MATMEELETTKTEPEKKPIRRARGYFDYSLLFVWIFIMLWDMFYFIAQARMWR